MGWGRMFLLGNIGQQMDIEEVRGQLDNQFSRDASQDEQIRTLRRYNQELQLYMTAVVRLLVSKGVLSEAEIAETVRLVEKTDRRE